GLSLPTWNCAGAHHSSTEAILESGFTTNAWRTERSKLPALGRLLSPSLLGAGHIFALGGRPQVQAAFEVTKLQIAQLESGDTEIPPQQGERIRIYMLGKQLRID